MRRTEAVAHQQLVLDGMPARIDSGSIFTEGEIEAARRKVRATEGWISQNPAAWAFIKAQVIEAARNGRRLGGRALVERVRWYDFAGSDGTPTRVPNDIAGVVPRLIARERPELAGVFRFSRTALDVVMGDAGDA